MPKAPSKPARRSPSPKVRAGVIHRNVDLGREEEFVTWNEWFARAMAGMVEVLPKADHARLQFRVTLVDGRQLIVRQVLSHVVRGRCTLQESRWSEAEAICDVITGYLLLGVGEDDNFAAVALPPREIMSVECVLAPQDENEAAPTPFGFYKREGLHMPPLRREIEEHLE